MIKNRRCWFFTLSTEADRFIQTESVLIHSEVPLEGLKVGLASIKGIV